MRNSLWCIRCSAWRHIIVSLAQSPVRPTIPLPDGRTFLSPGPGCLACFSPLDGRATGQRPSLPRDKEPLPLRSLRSCGVLSLLVHIVKPFLRSFVILVFVPFFLISLALQSLKYYIPRRLKFPPPSIHPFQPLSCFISFFFFFSLVFRYLPPSASATSTE